MPGYGESWSITVPLSRITLRAAFDCPAYNFLAQLVITESNLHPIGEALEQGFRHDAPRQYFYH